MAGPERDSLDHHHGSHFTAHGLLVEYHGSARTHLVADLQLSFRRTGNLPHDYYLAGSHIRTRPEMVAMQRLSSRTTKLGMSMSSFLFQEVLMQNINLTIDPTLTSGLMGIAKILLSREMIGLVITGVAVGALTFGFLDLFMQSGLKIEFPHKRMNPKKASGFLTAVAILAITFVPLSIVVAQAYWGQLSFLNGMKSFITAGIVSIGGCWLLSWILKIYIPKEQYKHESFMARQLMIGQAFRVIVDTIANYAAEIIARFGIGVMNLVVKIIHKPFIVHYAIVAFGLNVLMSIVLIKIMGSSNAAGQANLAGSLIGGLLHWAVRGRKVKALREQYHKEYEETKEQTT
jgi:hypothetical protein